MSSVIMSRYKYTITWYDETNNRDIDAEGYVFGKNYIEAVDQLMRYYGDDETCNLSLKLTDIDCDYVCETKSSE